MGYLTGRQARRSRAGRRGAPHPDRQVPHESAGAAGEERAYGVHRVRRASAGGELLAFCNEMPFFADRRVVLVENSGLFKSSNEDFAKKLVEIEDTSVAIFVEMDVDTRYKLFKAVDKNGEALDFATPDEKMMVTWVKSLFRADGVATTDTAIYKIIEAANMDMNCIKNEVDKMISYAGDTKHGIRASTSSTTPSTSVRLSLIIRLVLAI